MSILQWGETLDLFRCTWGLAVARLPASAFLIVVHGTVLAALFATGWFFSGKAYGANRCRQNRTQDLRV